MAAFFRDMPWLKVPKERQTIFVEPARHRGGGLLGGAGEGSKMSKLQALAAARKKKAESSRKSHDGGDGRDEAGDKLKELSLRDAGGLEASKGKVEEREGPAKRRRLGAEAEPRAHDTSTGDKKTKSPVQHSREDDGDSMELDRGPGPGPEGTEALIARPSAFARTLFASASEHPSGPRVERFPLPYLALAPSCIEDAFSGPSPDDAVLAAQAKGSLSGKAKK